MAQRSFQNRVQYQEGRKARGSRESRAMGKASKFGKREAEEGTVAVRTLGAEHQKVMSLADAIALLRSEGTPPDLAAG
jgi:threonyl-tRNA synthetase